MLTFLMDLWLFFMFLVFILDIIISLAAKEFKADNKISLIISILAGLCLGLLCGIAFGQNGKILFIWNGALIGISWYSIFAVLAFTAIGATVAKGGGYFAAKTILFIVKKITDKDERKKKMTITQKLILIGIITGITVITLFYIGAVEFELTFNSILLWLYIPIFGACLGLGFVGPIIAIIYAYSGKWVKK
jgi:hypothetical protein